MKTDLFQSCGHCWVFQICWHIECSTFTASSFRIWNSSTGIPSHPQALFLVMFPKAHFTSHSRMSASRWVVTPLALHSFIIICIMYYNFSPSILFIFLFQIPKIKCLNSLISLYFTVVCQDIYFKFSSNISACFTVVNENQDLNFSVFSSFMYFNIMLAYIFIGEAELLNNWN